MEWTVAKYGSLDGERDRERDSGTKIWIVGQTGTRTGTK